MIKIFFSSAYNIQHKLITEDNALDMLKDDIRSKIIGDTSKFVYGNEGVIIKGNPNIMYIGGFYYEKKTSAEYNQCENTVRTELEQIDNSDIVLVSLLKYSAIASITELLYASFKQKKIVVFCSKDITQFKVEYEYWFSIITAMTIDKNIELVYVDGEKDIINYINNLKEDSND